MSKLYFDIETAPLPMDELEAMIPEFKPEDVKLGNLKDPDKIDAKITEAASCHRQNFIDNAALSPLTGRVLAIGVADKTDFFIVSGPEEILLRNFWLGLPETLSLCGFNVLSFDLPFLIRRSWKYGIQVPSGLREGRYWSRNIIDLRERWCFGDRYEKGTLNDLLKFFGLPEKKGDGKDFYKLWESDREAAIEYLRWDVESLRELDKVMA